MPDLELDQFEIRRGCTSNSNHSSSTRCCFNIITAETAPYVPDFEPIITLPDYHNPRRTPRKRKPRMAVPGGLRPPPPDGVSKYVMARDIAGTVFPVSEDLILREARKHGIGRKMGRVIIFSPDDIQRLYEVMPCPSSSFAAPNPRTGSSAAPSGASALKKALALITDASPKKSARSARAKSSPNPSTVVELPARSRKRR